MKNIAFVLMMIISVTLIFSGCGNAAPDSGPRSEIGQASPTNDVPAERNEYPKTVTHAMGKTVIPNKPVNIVTTSFAGADHLFAMGVAPVATGALEHMEAFGIYEHDLDKHHVEDLGVSPSYEKMLAIQPDLIISFDWEGVDYDKLSQIAPTIVLDSTDNPYFFKRTFLEVADAIGATEAANEYLKKFTDRLDEVRSIMEEKGYAGKTATFISTTQKGYFVYSDKTVSTYYADLGFATIPGVNLDQEVSLEGLSKIDADFIFLGEDYKMKGDTLKKLEQSAVWNSIRAVKEHRVHVMNTAAFGPMAAGQVYGVDTIGKFLQ